MLFLREDLFKKPVFLAVALAWAGSCKLYLWDPIFLHSFPACRWLRKIIVFQVYDWLLSWWHSLVCWSFYCTLCTGRLPRKAWICCMCNCCKYLLYEYITYPQKWVLTYLNNNSDDITLSDTQNEEDLGCFKTFSEVLGSRKIYRLCFIELSQELL